jgi:hypothetical protein
MEVDTPEGNKRNVIHAASVPAVMDLGYQLGIGYLKKQYVDTAAP